MPFTNFEDVTLSLSSHVLLFRELTITAMEKSANCKCFFRNGGASLWDEKYREIDAVTQEGLVKPSPLPSQTPSLNHPQRTSKCQKSRS